MRTVCKTEGCGEPVQVMGSKGAHGVYCLECDRKLAKERMRTLKARRLSDAAKDLFETKSGQVYIISNPAFPGWVKVGRAYDAKDRLRSYQTSSPFRDYTLEWSLPTRDASVSEHKAHVKLEAKFDRRGEWFKVTPELAEAVLEKELKRL